MPYDHIPYDDEVKSLLEGSGIDVPCELNLDGYVASAMRDFEKRTGYKPFLMDESFVDRFYDPPRPSSSGQTLFLDAGLIEVESVTVGYAGPGTGTELIKDQDFFLQDYNAAAEERPYEMIEFSRTVLSRSDFYYVRPVVGATKSIKVSGKWGYWSTIPDDVYKALIRGAASLALTDLKQGLASGLVEYAEDDVKERYSVELIQKLGDGYEAFANRVIKNYKFVS